MLSNDALRLNLRLFVMLEHGLEKIRIVANTNVPSLSVMGVTDLGQLQEVLEAGDIDHYLVCSGDVFLGNFTVQAVEKSPKSMVERLNKALEQSEQLPHYAIVCSSSMTTEDGLEAVSEWFDSNRNVEARAK